MKSPEKTKRAEEGFRDDVKKKRERRKDLGYTVPGVDFTVLLFRESIRRISYSLYGGIK